MTNIEWTDATWNPIAGCSKVGEGCANCYALPTSKRLAAMQPGGLYAGVASMERKGKLTWTGRVAFDGNALLKPLHWRKPRQIFVNSMSDLFHESVPDEWIDQIFAVMALCPQHTFQVLTKRPERMREYLAHKDRAAFVRGEAVAIDREANIIFSLPNVWLGVSVWDQASADEFVPPLLATPAASRFVSYEPALGPVDWTPWLDATGIECMDNCPDSRVDGGIPDGANRPQCPNCGAMASWISMPPLLHWIIAGGESGPKARPAHPDWFRAVRDQCAAAGVPFFFKQWGEWGPAQPNDIWLQGRWIHRSGSTFSRVAGEPFRPVPTAAHMINRGKKAAGRLLDGQEHNGRPE